MLKHYFTIAFRNLIKYKIQTIISIIGLAIGLACFSLSALWQNYESSFDHFHAKADRIYRLRAKYKKDTFVDNTYTFYNMKISALMTDLMSKYPQIEDMALYEKSYLFSKSPDRQLNKLEVTSSFLKIFDISESISGCGISEPEPVIITDKLAKEFFNNQEPIGQTIEEGKEIYEVKAVTKGWPTNTNMPFDVIQVWDGESYENSFSAIILLHEGVDVGLFNKILSQYKNKDLFGVIDYEFELVSIKSVRQEFTAYYTNIEYDQINKFSLVGLLIIICAVFNYLILFISRIKIRYREFALRKVNGASNLSFFSLLGVEVLLILCCSLVFGIILIRLIFEDFKDLTKVSLADSQIYAYALTYCVGVVVCIMAIVLFQILCFGNKSLHQGISGGSVGYNKLNHFNKISIILQLIIGIGLIFCTSVFIKQINYLKNDADLGFNYENIAEIHTAPIYGGGYEALVSKIKNLPHIKKVISTPCDLWRCRAWLYINSWDGRSSNDTIPFNLMPVKYDFFDFYGIKFIRGEAPNAETLDKEEKTICYINEEAMKIFGWADPIGKRIDGMEVYGVVKNLILHPRLKVEPYILSLNRDSDMRGVSYTILYEDDGIIYRAETIEAIKELSKEFSSIQTDITYKSSIYQDFFKSEEALLKILKIGTVVCILISVFGIYSVVSLVCTHRRKEIAVRKVNGATVSSILYYLIKEQLILVLIASVISFPVAYKVMKIWLQDYAQQTNISWWIFLSILLGAIIVVVITVFGQVWRAANQNPAEVLKSE